MEEKWFLIALQGGIDIMRSIALEKEIDEAIQNGVRRVEIDLSKLHFLSSSGIRVLLSAKTKLKPLEGELKLTGVNPTVRKLFRLMHLEKTFCLEKDS